MTNKQKKKWIYRLISAILVLVICFCVYIIGSSLLADRKAQNEVDRVYNIVETTADSNKEFTKESYKALKNENGDFKAYIKWNSGIIEQPIMQATNNDYYLHRSFDGNYYESGSIFFDAATNMEDTNVIVYGHNNSYNHEIMFSHINDIARDQKYYETNDRFKIYYEDEIREYAICYVYYITEEQFQDYDFLQANFETKQEFDEFMKFPTENNLVISKNGTIDYGNNFVTLQTCKRLNQDIKVVAVAKEILVKNYR